MAMTPWDQPLESGCPRMRDLRFDVLMRVGRGVEVRVTFTICHQIIQLAHGTP